MALAALKEELEVWDSALRAFDAKDYETALATFESFSDTSKIVTNIGLIRVLQGEYELATKSFSDAIELDKFLAIAFFQRGVCHLHLKLFEKASEDFGETQIKLRGNTYINYEELGLSFMLHSAEVLFNRAKALVHTGRKEEGATYLQRAISACSEERHARIKDASATSIEDMEPFAVPESLLFRPSPSKRKFLQEYEASSSSIQPPQSNAGLVEDHVSPPSPRISELAKSDVSSSTCAPSSGSEVASNKKSFRSFSTALASSSSSSRPLRSDLIKVMGSDPILPTTEITSIPCAGVRIPYGKLSGLMAWRFVVELDTDPSNSKQKRSSRQSQSQSQLPKGLPRPGVVSNFILDTGSSSSHVSQETLKALGYKGIYKAGTEVHLRIQGVSTKCLIARYGEAGRLGGQFMTAGSLTFYFDTKLNAPVLYAGDTNERPTDIPRTVTLDPNRKARRNSLRDSVYAIMTSLHLIRAGESSA